MAWWLLLALSVYLVVVAVWDLRTLHIPNWLTLPAVGAVLAWRGYELARGIWLNEDVRPLLTVFAYWCGVFILWAGGAIGGGDAKLLMVLLGLFPDYRFLALLLAVTGGIIGMVLVARYARERRLHVLVGNLAFRLLHLQLFPPRAEVEQDGEPTAFLFSLAGLIWILLVLLGKV